METDQFKRVVVAQWGILESSMLMRYIGKDITGGLVISARGAYQPVLKA
jgi:hypothetical protein